MADQPDLANLEPVSAEHNGIILSGVGVTEDALAETMETRTADREGTTPEPAAEAPSPAEPPANETPEQAAQRARDEKTGQFTKPRRADKRIDQLTKQRTEAEAKAAEYEKRLADYEAKLAALEARQQPAAVSQPTAERPAPIQPPAGEPNFETDYEAQVGTKYATYGAAVQAFNRDYAQFQARQFDARLRDSIEADRASRAFQSHVSSVFDQGRKAYADFDAVVNASIQFPDAMLIRIAQMPDAHAVMYALGKDHTLATRIASTTDPVMLGWELARLVTPAAVASSASTALAVSSAPAPYQPVGSGSKTTVPTLDELAAAGGDDYDRSGYRERRRTERMARR